MRFLSVFLIAFGGSLSATLAADINTAPVPVYDFGTSENLRLTRSDWSGFNVVVFGGGGTLQGKDNVGNKSFFRSGMVGGSVGYDQQFNKFVLGVGLEGALTNFVGSTRSGNSRQSSNWVSSATFRAGYDAGRFMPYVSAGMGFGNYKVERKSNGASDDNTFVGFVAGAGVEARITDGLFARIDYKHYEFAEKSFNVPGLTTFTVEGSADLVSAGLGYRF